MTAPMTLSAWQALSKQERVTAWRTWNNVQRTEMFELFASITPGFALPFPDDYNDPADSPLAIRELAIATDDALGLMLPSATADATYVKGPSSIDTTDWNLAIESGFYRAAPDALNLPSTSFGTWWFGIVSNMNPDYIKQIVWPAYNYSSQTMLQRAMVFGTWESWSRVVNYPQSWALLDNMVIMQHTRAAGHPQKSRFAMGMRKDQANVSPTSLDEWRVQCYDMEGEFTWSAIKILEDGIVSMPRGHALTAKALQNGETIKPEQAATIGNVVEIVRAMLAGVNPEIANATDDGTE